MVILAFSLIPVINVLFVALGLGLVIFIHELGHFAVAKWCGVKVERFSIGFGPILWKITRGDTEYALSAIPFGGYVKMLGQDDADPSQLTDERIARDPRSYTSKSVPQRIAIISAGVINNMVSAVLFFVIAFMFGVQYQPAIVGQVTPGMPAWVQGLRSGDRLTSIGGREDRQLRFDDVRQAVALSSGPVKVKGLRKGEPFEMVIDPETKDKPFPTIGIEPLAGMKLRDDPKPKTDDPAVTTNVATFPGSPASKATPEFQPGDEIRQVDDEPVQDYSELQAALAAKREKTVEISVRRKGETEDQPLTRISVGPNHFRTLGLRMDIGKITAIRQHSPAAQEGAPATKSKLRVGDKITHVISDDRERSVGSDLDPLQLPDYFASLHGKEVIVRVRRDVPAKDPDIVEVTLVPEDRPGWIERPLGQDVDEPLSVPAIGIAFHVLHHVVKVEPGSAADGKIGVNDNIQKMEFFNEKGEPQPENTAVKFSEKERNWAAVFWKMQGEQKIKLTVRSQGAKEDRTVELELQPDPNWFIPIRGLSMQQLVLTRKADNIGEAITLGFRHTRDSVVDMWLTIKSLTSGRISPKMLGGPIAIFRVAYHFAGKGLPDLILFLGMLSVSLAVLNFLPIPVLDGGHFIFLCWEGVRGKPASERVVITANYVGLAMVLSLMLWVLYQDISGLIMR